MATKEYVVSKPVLIGGIMRQKGDKISSNKIEETFAKALIKNNYLKVFKNNKPSRNRGKEKTVPAKTVPEKKESVVGFGDPTREPERPRNTEIDRAGG